MSAILMLMQGKAGRRVDLACAAAIVGARNVVGPPTERSSFCWRWRHPDSNNRWCALPRFSTRLDDALPGERIIRVTGPDWYLGRQGDRWEAAARGWDGAIRYGRGPTEIAARRVAGLQVLQHMDGDLAQMFNTFREATTG